MSRTGTTEKYISVWCAFTMATGPVPPSRGLIAQVVVNGQGNRGPEIMFTAGSLGPGVSRYDV